MSLGIRFAMCCITAAFLTACATTSPRQVDLSTPEIINWPEPGWLMYPSLGTASGVGSVFGVTDNGERGEVSDIEIEIPASTPDIPRTIARHEDSTLAAKLFARYALQRESANADLSFTNNRNIEITVELAGTKRVTLKGRQLETGMLEKLDITQHDLLRYKSLWIRSSVETATNIVFTLNTEAVKHFGSQLAFKSLTGAEGGIGKYFSNGNFIIVTSAVPLNVAYKPLQLDVDWWRKHRRVTTTPVSPIQGNTSSHRETKIGETSMSTGTPARSVPKNVPLAEQELKDLRVAVTSLRRIENPGLRITFVFENIGPDALWCALSEARGPFASFKSRLTDAAGTGFYFIYDDLFGLKGFRGKNTLTEIGAGQSLTVTGRIHTDRYEKAVPPLEIQMEVMASKTVEDDPKPLNFLLSVPQLKN